MTTRAQLESEREALRTTLDRLKYGPLNHKHAERDALVASIARVDALLSLTDEQVISASEEIEQRIDLLTAEHRWVSSSPTITETIDALHAIKKLIQRKTS